MSRWFIALAVLLLFLLPHDVSSGLDVDITNHVPSFIHDDHLNLTGTSRASRVNWTETTNNHFTAGTQLNLTVKDGSLLHWPELDLSILNSGNGVLQGGASDWDRYILDQCVLKHNGTYWMFYTGGTSVSALGKYALMSAYHIGVATSKDGLNWTRYSGNPVVRSRVNSYDYTNVMYPTVLVENGTWHMYYAGNKGNKASGDLQDLNVCYATSTDGFNWTKYSSNPVLTHGSPISAWNGIDIRPTSIIREGDHLRMYFKAVGQAQPSNLGGATSKDFVSWNLLANKALYVGDSSGWEDGVTEYNTLEVHNGTYRMWTHADRNTWHVGWIWSRDGINWTDSGSPLISPTAGTIYANDVENPAVVEEGDHYLVYTTCWDSSNNRRVACFRAVIKKLDGTYTSSVKDEGAEVEVTGMSWDADVPSGSEMEILVRWSNDSATWSTWYDVTIDGAPTGVRARYFQYRAMFHAQRDWVRSALNESVLDLEVPIVDLMVRVDGGPWTVVNGTFDDWYLNVSLKDGDYDIEVRVRDTFDNVYYDVLPVKVDLYPPTGNITLEDGRYAHNSYQVKIDVMANDTHPPFQMQLSRQPDFAGASWIDHIPSATYQLLGTPEGPVTIYMRLRDAAGRVSETYNDTIVIDTTPPEGTLLIDGGAKYTNSTYVTLSVNWSDLTGVIGMMVSNDPDFPGAMWQDPMDALAWSIGEADGVHTVYVRLRDMVGWETVLTDDIILDRTPPAASLSINQDAIFTTSRAVTLNITLYDTHPISYKLADLDGDWPDSWRSTGSPEDVPWTLPAGPDGQRTVRMLVRDAAGNEFVTSDDIVLDTTPPEGELMLNDGEPFTNLLLVTATLTASDATSGMDRMRVSGSDNFTGASWQTVKGTFTWSLSPGDGTKGLFVELRDVAGLTTVVDASIVLDTTPPTGAVAIKDVGAYADRSSVELLIEFQDAYGIDEMMVSDDAGFTDAVWVPYATLYPWDLGEVEGETRVYVKARDMAGNEFTASVGTVLDLTDPVVSASTPEPMMSRTVGLTWSASDAIGLDELVIQWDGFPSSIARVPLDGATTMPMTTAQVEITDAMTPGGEEVYELVLRIAVADLSGRTTHMDLSIHFVPEAPSGTVAIEEGAEWTNGTTVAISLTHSGGLSPTHFRLASTEEGLRTAEWMAWDTASTFGLAPPGGEKRVWGQLQGRFGILSEPIFDDIKLDVLAPSVIIDSPARESTEEDSAKLIVSVTDDQDPAPMVEWRLNGGEWSPYTGEERLGLKTGRNLVEVRSQDAAGNVATAEWEMTYDTGLSVSGVSWLIILVVVVVVVVVAVYYWKKRPPGQD